MDPRPHLVTFLRSITRSTRGMFILLAIAIGAAGTVAVATVPGHDGVIHACVQTSETTGLPNTAEPNLRVIDPAGGQTCNTAAGAGPGQEETLDFNQRGPQGGRGPAGPPANPCSSPI